MKSKHFLPKCKFKKLTIWLQLHAQLDGFDYITNGENNACLSTHVRLHSLGGWDVESEACFHDDVIKWKHFLRYWTFVRGIHRSPVNSPHKGQWRRALIFLWSAPEYTAE